MPGSTSVVSPELQAEVKRMGERIAELEAHIRRSVACIESLTPYVMWDGVDGEDEQAKVQVTVQMLREAVCRDGPGKPQNR
jgi:hypothetical protein